MNCTFHHAAIWHFVHSAAFAHFFRSYSGLSFLKCVLKTYEDAADDPAKIAIYSGLVGQEQTFNYADIVPTPSSEGQQVDPDTIEV